jgi:hypothetical protein
MKFLHQRKGAAQNLAFLGLMCALNAVVATLSTLVPLSSLFVIIFLPLVSSLTVILCEDKYTLVYVIAAIALSLSVTAYDITATLFYIIPAIIVGALYGFLLKKGFPTAYLIFVAALLEMALNYAALPLIQLMTGKDFLATLVGLLGLGSDAFVPKLYPTLIFAYSLMEVVLSHLVTSSVITTLKIETPNYNGLTWIYEILAISFSICAIGVGFAEISWAYWCLSAGLYFLVFSLLTYIRKLPVWTYILLGVMGAAGWVLFACLYSLMGVQAGLLLLGLVTISFAIPCLIVRLLFRVTPSVTTTTHE